MDIEEMHDVEAEQNNEISDEDLGDVAGGNIFKKAKKGLKKAKKAIKKSEAGSIAAGAIGGGAIGAAIKHGD